jgi:hypothetical protein
MKLPYGSEVESSAVAGARGNPESARASARIR